MDQASRGKYYTAAASFIRQYVALAQQAARHWDLKWVEIWINKYSVWLFEQTEISKKNHDHEPERQQKDEFRLIPKLHVNWLAI